MAGGRPEAGPRESPEPVLHDPRAGSTTAFTGSSGIPVGRLETFISGADDSAALQLQRELGSLREELRRLGAESERLGALRRANAATVSEQRAQLEQLAWQFDELQRERSAEASGELRALQERLRSLEGRQDTIHRELGELAAEEERLRLEAAEDASAAAQAEQRAAQRRQLRRTAASERAALGQQIALLQQHEDGLAHQLAELRAAGPGAESAEAAEEERRLQLRLDGLRQELSELAAQAERLAAERRRLAAERDAAQRRRNVWPALPGPEGASDTRRRPPGPQRALAGCQEECLVLHALCADCDRAIELLSGYTGGAGTLAAPQVVAELIRIRRSEAEGLQRIVAGLRRRVPARRPPDAAQRPAAWAHASAGASSCLSDPGVLSSAGGSRSDTADIRPLRRLSAGGNRNGPSTHRRDSGGAAEESDPTVLRVACPELGELQGDYELVRGHRHCGLPVWQHRGGAAPPRRLYSGTNQRWILTADAGNMQADMGVLASRETHGGRPPHAIADWLIHDGGGWVALGSVQIRPA